jgi:hypothetical protein
MNAYWSEFVTYLTFCDSHEPCAMNMNMTALNQPNSNAFEMPSFAQSVVLKVVF